MFFETKYISDKFPRWKITDGRAAIAKALFDAGTPLPRLFQKKEDGQTPLLGLSPFRFFTGEGYVGVIALGHPDSAYLEEASAKIRRALSSSFNTPVAESRREGYCSARKLDKLIDASISDFCVFYSSNKSANRELWDLFLTDPANPKLIDFATGLLRESILQQAEMMNASLDEDSLILGDLVVQKARPFPLHGKRWVWSMDATFRTNYRLQGPWAAGRLINRGSGRIRFAPIPSKTIHCLAEVA